MAAWSNRAQSQTVPRLTARKSSRPTKGTKSLCLFDHIMNMAEALDLKDAKTMNAEYVGREKHAAFRSMVGMFFWFSFEHPDIQHSAKRLRQFLVEPLVQDWIALKRTVRYSLGDEFSQIAVRSRFQERFH